MQPSGPWINAAIWLGYSLVGLLLPVGFGVIVLGAMELDITVEALTGAGQFAIYSVAMWITAYYLLTKRSRLFLLPASDLLGLTCLIGAAFAVLLFVLATVSSNGADLNNEFFQWPSVALFLASAISGFITVGLDNKYSAPDPLASRSDQERALKDEFSRTDAAQENSND